MGPTRDRPRGKVSVASLFLVIVVGLLSVGPVLTILVLSLDVSGQAMPFRIGLDGWRQLLSDDSAVRAFTMSFLLALRVPLGLLIALVFAWLIVRVRVPGHRLFEFAFWFAYFLPTVPMISGWILFLNADFGLFNHLLSGLGAPFAFNINSVSGLIWVHLTLQTIPIGVILLSPALRMIDRALDDAALVSGAGPLTILRRITVPLALPALMVAGLATMIKALESFEVEQILGVPAGINVFSNKVYEFAQDDPPRMAEAMAFSSVFLVVLVGLALINQRVLRARLSRDSLTDQRATHWSDYGKSTRVFGATILAIFVLVAVVLPVGMLVLGSFMQLFGFWSLADTWTLENWRLVLFGSAFRQSFLATLQLGFATSAIGVMLFLAIAWALASVGRKLAEVAAVLIWLPWAFPGVIIGVVLLELTLTAPGWSMLHATAIPLIIGLLIREMPIGVHMLRTSIDQVGRDMTAAAQLAGASGMRTFLKVVLPLNFPAVVVVFMIIFAATIRDVSTTVLIAPPDMQTLALLTFRYTLLSQYEAATVVGTIVAVMSLGVSASGYWLMRRIDRST